MAHCPSCGKRIEKPSKEKKDHNYTIQAFDCQECHHHFQVTINSTIYIV